MKKTLLLSALAGITTSALGGIMYNTPGDSYSQNFDSLATTGTANAWSNNSTIAGWHLFQKDGFAITQYAANNGVSTTGSFYSYGSTDSTDRALGGLGSGGTYFGSPAAGTVAGWIAMSVVNNTGGMLTEFTISFNGEQWRNGGNTTAQPMVLEYGFGATFGAVASWTAPGGTFNWTSPVATSSNAAVDGNVAGRVNGVGGTISDLSWNHGGMLWVRWVELNDAGNDHGLAIDDVSFSAIPTPGAIALLGMGGLMISRRRR
ncbi:MAG: hypothetical protein KF859_05885 [Phycisphaeraceae bacterium]|nr:hypothetical protein [Phycisphaeraceae bacterium]